MKTSELTGAALDWAVTSIEDPDALRYGIEDWREQRRTAVKNGEYLHRYHQSWAQGGQLIERERITVGFDHWYEVDAAIAVWGAFKYFDGAEGYGPTPLIAACRCFVASRLGDEVDVPKELL